MVRARIVLAAADGVAPTRRIAAELGIVRGHRPQVAQPVRRPDGLAGLEDRPRPGRPRRFTPVQVAEVKALACTPPAEAEVPLSRWSGPELAAAGRRAGLVAAISPSTVRRWLAADAIKPWQHRSWIFPRDPDFAAKAARVLDLYARHWEGRQLGADEYVISADEKSQLQALRRRHRDRRPGPGAPAGSSSSTPAAAPWPTSPPTTSTTPR